MIGNDFVRRIRRVARARGLLFRYDPKRGKGSHGTIYFGNRKAVVPDLKRELKAGTLAAMLRQLGLTRDDLE